VIPAAPWHSAIDALLWFHPATPAARGELPQPLAARAGIAVTIGGLISYREGPVGPYGEVFGAPVMLRGAPLLSHVAFMAVDSEDSVAGGRRNWALPKVVASFEGDPGRPGTVTARGDGWSLCVTTTARPRRAPFVGTFRCSQAWPDGRVRDFTVRMRGRARLAHAEIRHGVTSSLAGWLVDGRHPAILISGTQDVSVPRPRPQRRGLGGVRSSPPGRGADARSSIRPSSSPASRSPRGPCDSAPRPSGAD
jgi:Acetoacetate decarboxylase (ADC)